MYIDKTAFLWEVEVSFVDYWGALIVDCKTILRHHQDSRRPGRADSPIEWLICGAKIENVKAVVARRFSSQVIWIVCWNWAEILWPLRPIPYAASANTNTFQANAQCVSSCESCCSLRKSSSVVCNTVYLSSQLWVWCTKLNTDRVASKRAIKKFTRLPYEVLL